jgi:hypothetical protein
MEFLEEFGLAEGIDFSTIRLTVPGYREVSINDPHEQISFNDTSLNAESRISDLANTNEVNVDDNVPKLVIDTTSLDNDLPNYKNISIEQIRELVNSPLVKEFSPIEHSTWSISQADFPYSILDNNVDVSIDGVFFFSISPLSLFVSKFMSVRISTSKPSCLYLATNPQHKSPNKSFTIEFCVPAYLFCAEFPKEFEDFSILDPPSRNNHDAVLFNLVSPSFQLLLRKDNTLKSKSKILKL